MGKIHCLDVGCGDATVIETASATFLIDCHNIGEHASNLPKSKKLRGVFITHQHTDHFSGLEYLYNAGFSIEWLIYSPYERRAGDNSVTLDEWNEFERLRGKFVKNGTQCTAPYRQASFDKPFWETDSAKFYVVGPDKGIAKRSTREIHDACLVVTAMLGDRKCVFAGDASDTNLEYVASNTNKFCDDILHASHHGSLNGADLSFIQKSNPKYTVISTCSGVFPSVPHSTALARYKNNTTEKVYRTDIDGTLSFSF